MPRGGDFRVVIEIVVIDNFEPDRDCVRTLLSAQGDFTVTGMGRDGYDALRLVEHLRPHIALVEMDLTYPDGIIISPLLKRRCHHTRTVIFTSTDDREHIIRAAAGGVDGYFLKHSDLEILPRYIRHIHSGNILYSPAIADMAIRFLSAPPERPPEPPPKRQFERPPLKKFVPKREKMSIPSGISKAELQVIASLAAGYTNKEIAETLRLKQGTVRNYISSAIQKAGLQDRTQVVVFALTHGLIQGPEKTGLSP
ncbi:MAG: response regulator transcription factor [Treponema sp.]|jgi:DNA-binding NarL/FixJ family response regulator|nr:response regulator transcription factor [Treponema sp.]